jgi:acyl-coenzyme A thioesterase PaaI-like protein
VTPVYDTDPRDPDEAALFDLADGVRRLIDTTVRTHADADRLKRAADLVREATELIDVARRPDDDWDVRRYNAISGGANPIAIPLLPTVTGQDLRADMTFGRAYEGPPGYVHGGMLAAVLDQILGHANGAAGTPGMTARLTVSYRRPTPLDVPLVVHARNDGCEGRKIYASGRIEVDGKTTVEAEGLFIAPTHIQQYESFHGALSEADGIPRRD